MNSCRTTGCRRTVRQSSSGIIAAHCDACTKAILRDAFASEPVSWWRRARDNNLPVSVVGGSPA